MFATDRSQPIRTWASAGAFSRRRFGTSKGISVKPSASSPASEWRASGLKVEPIGGNAVRCSQAMVLPSASRPAVEVLRAHGVVVPVADLVLARPRDLDRAAHLPRQERRLDDVVGLRLAAEPAAQERDVNSDVLLRNAQGLGHPRDAGHGVLGAGPDLAAVALDRGQGGGGLDGAVDQVRGVVGGRHLLRCAARARRPRPRAAGRPWPVWPPWPPASCGRPRSRSCRSTPDPT